MTLVRVTVDNRIRMSAAELGEDPVAALKADFTHVNPQREMLRRIGKPHWSEPKTIETWAQEGDELSLPRGGMPRVRRRLEAAGMSREVVDERQGGEPVAFFPFHRMTLHPFQEETVRLVLERECGIIRAPTGSGKSCVAFAAASRARVPCLVVVYNQGLLEQWVKRAGKELGLAPTDVGIVQGSTRRLRPFTVGMQQTLSSRGVDPRLAGYFGMVVVDEVHRAAARTMYAAVDPFPARYRIGISADHRRKDRKEFLTEDLFGGVVDDVSRKDLIQSGHVLEVQIRVVPTDFEAPWYGMPTEDEPEREVDTVRLAQQMSEDFSRNELALAQVLGECGENQVLVFSQLREHCLVLDQRLVALGVKTGFLIGGEDYRREFRRTVDGVESGQVRVAVGTYLAVGQALDLPTVSVGVCATPIASNRQVFNQVRGRFCRTAVGKKGARLYYLWDWRVFGAKHLKNITQWNADVVVLEGDRWVPGREYLDRMS